MNKEAIIDAVFARQAIWDKGHQNHHTGAVLIKLWKEIAAECHLEEKSVKATWKRLRETYRKKLGERLINEANGTSHNSNWPYFESLHFLRDQMTPLPQSGDISSATDSKHHLFGPQSGGNIKAEVFNEDYGYIDVPSPVNLGEISPTHSAHSPNSGSMRGRVQQENFEDLPKKYKQVDEDEDVAFFDSILPHVRNLTAKQKLKFRIRVLQILEEDIPTIE